MSRRALLAGAGGVAGALALGAMTETAGASPPPLGPDDPLLVRARLAQQAGFPPLGTFPGVHYRCWSMYDAVPLTFSSGRTLTSTGAYATSGGQLRISLGLEAGITINETTHAVANSSGSDAVGVTDRQGLDGSIPEQATTNIIPTGSASTIQVVSAFTNRVVSEADFWSAGIVTSSTVRWYGFRLGYVPFGFGYTPIAPKRVYDSRAGNPPLGVTKGPLSNGTRVINLLNGVTLPSGVKPKGLLVNLAVVNTSASGFLSLYENGQPDPQTSSINWFTANEIVANTTYTAVDATGQAIAKVPANASTDFFIDVVGYYA
ncbi:MAG: hypothetical protein U0Q07_04285 [Acidimicrobiales bacterium]